jgi:DNA gyrase/topoisomerase IV subunit A
MSPIGRIFIVVNLGLAFAFVGVAGTYLKHATNFKEKFDLASAELEDAKKKASAELAAVQGDFEGVKNNLTRSESNLKSTETRLEESKTENERLMAQVASIEGSLKESQSSLKTIKDAIEASTAKADDAYKMAVKASDERNESVSARIKAEDELKQALAKIKDTEDKLAESNGLVARLKEEVGEKETMLAYVKINNGGLLPNPVPSMSGSVVTVGKEGKLLTVKIDRKSGDPKPGHNLAIYANNQYKGEFVVDTVEGDFLFGRLTKQVAGASVAAGDRADSHPGR